MTDVQDAEAIKRSRLLLRRIDEHDQAIAAEDGAQRVSVNMLDVVYHPTNPLPTLNYMTPRRGAAWVSARALEEASEQLIQRERAPRLLYFEGLMPPVFRQTVEAVGLQWLGESAIYAAHPVATFAQAEAGYAVSYAQDHESVAQWWMARCTLLTGRRRTTSASTEVVAHMSERLHRGQSSYVMVRSGRSLSGVASLRIQRELASAEINAFHVSPGDAANAPALMAAAMRAAGEQRCDLVFVGEAVQGQQWLAQFGFIRLGNVVAYAARPPSRAVDNERMAQPILRDL